MSSNATVIIILETEERTASFTVVKDIRDSGKSNSQENEVLPPVVQKAVS